MTILEEISAAFYHFNAINGKPPVRLYLGHKQYYALKSSKEYRYFQTGIDSDEIMGMKIHHVLEESHIFIA